VSACVCTALNDAGRKDLESFETGFDLMLDVWEQLITQHLTG
jgi:hypothetical protein